MTCGTALVPNDAAISGQRLDLADQPPRLAAADHQETAMLLHHDIRLSVTRAHHADLIREAQGTRRRRRPDTPGSPDRRYSHR